MDAQPDGMNAQGAAARGRVCGVPRIGRKPEVVLLHRITAHRLRYDRQQPQSLRPARIVGDREPDVGLPPEMQRGRQHDAQRDRDLRLRPRLEGETGSEQHEHRTPEHRDIRIVRPLRCDEGHDGDQRQRQGASGQVHVGRCLNAAPAYLPEVRLPPRCPTVPLAQPRASKKGDARPRSARPP